MTEKTEQVATQRGAAAADITLEDFIEAATRGVTRAWAAPDDVGGYALHAVSPPSYCIGFVVYCRPPFPSLDPRVPIAGQPKSVRE